MNLFWITKTNENIDEEKQQIIQTFYRDIQII